jgi:hypothetical protein
MKARAKFDYDPKKFIWTVTIADEDKPNPFAEGKFGKSEHWLLPIAYTKAVGEYYGFFRPQV